MFWKKKTKFVPEGPIDYPAGICVSAPTGTFLIGKDGKKYRITSDRILQSWNFPTIVETTDKALSGIPTAVTKLGFRDGSLLLNVADGKVYLVSGSRLRHIQSVEVFEYLGKNRSDAMSVSEAEIKLMKLGDPLT